MSISQVTLHGESGIQWKGRNRARRAEPSWRQTTGDSKQHNWEGGKQGEHALQPDRKWGEELLSRQAGRGRVRSHTATESRMPGAPDNPGLTLHFSSYEN